MGLTSVDDVLSESEPCTGMIAAFSMINNTLTQLLFQNTKSHWELDPEWLDSQHHSDPTLKNVPKKEAGLKTDEEKTSTQKASS